MERLTELSLRSPRLTLLVMATIGVVAALGISGARLGAGAHAYLGDGHPEVREFEAQIAEFGGGYALTIAWACGGASDPCRSVFDAPSLRMADELHETLAAIPNVARVASPARTPLLVAEDDVLRAHRFVERGEVRSSPELAALALDDGLWQGALVSRDDSLGGVVLEVSSTKAADQFTVIEAVERALEPHEARGFRFRMSGLPWLQVAAHRGSAEETLRIGAITCVLVAVVVFALVRSLSSALAVVATIGLASSSAMGAAGALGWALDPVTIGAPTMILVIGAADAIHLVTCYWRQRGLGLQRELALRRAARVTARPCLITTLTAIAGMVTFAGAGSPALTKFGVLAALGIALCLLFTYSATPALIAVLPDSPVRAAEESGRWDERLRDWVRYPARFPQEFVGVATLLASVAVVGAARHAPDSNALDAWKKGAPVRSDVEFVASKLRSLEGLEIEVIGVAPVHDAQVFEEIVRVEDEIARIEGVKAVRSLRTALDRAAPLLEAERASGAIASEAFALVMGAAPETLASFVSADHSRGRIVVELPNLRNTERARIVSEVDAVLDDSSLEYEVTGTTPLQLAIESTMKRTAVAGTLASAAFVFGLTAYFFGSLRWGLLALLPNLPAVLALYGMAGFLEISLDHGAAIVAPLALGIAAADTIHVLHAYRRERFDGYDAVAAIQTAVRTVGHGLITTGVALALAFLAMVPSEFQTLTDIGALSALAILVAMATELTLLPALISRISWSRPQLTGGTRRDAPTH